MGQIVASEDRPLETFDSTRGWQPKDSTAVVMSATLAGSATFTSKWYCRSMAQPTVLVHFKGSQTATLYIEESWDGGNTVHNSYSQASATKTLADTTTIQTASISARLMAPQFRLKVVNGVSAQSAARLFAATSTLYA